MSEKIPAILQTAWSVCTPREQSLEEQVVPIERAFLIKFAQYVTDVYFKKEFDATAKELVVKDIIASANARFAVLVKEVNPSLTHAVVSVVLYLLSTILSNDHIKYKTQDEMLAMYPTFSDRPNAEKQNLFLTANWMDVLFRLLPARKNKGIAMGVIPKFVEGNGAHYVTGGGQTQATRDRVFIYETEGDCKPIKRVKRKSKCKLEEMEDALAAEEAEAEAKLQARKRLSVSEKPSPRKRSINFAAAATTTNRDSSDSSSVSSMYFPLPAPFFQAVPLPIPVISPRSQSSFSQAAAVIANFGQFQNSTLVSPRECYLDIEEDGTVVKKYSPRATALSASASRGFSGSVAPSADTPTATTTNSITSLPLSIPPLFLTEGGGGHFVVPARLTSSASSSSTTAPPTLTSSASASSQCSLSRLDTSNFDMFVEAIGNVDPEELGEAGDKQLALLREASADSDI